MNALNVTNMIFVSLAGESVILSADRWQLAADALNARHGGVPVVRYAVDGDESTHEIDDAGQLVTCARADVIAESERHATVSTMSSVSDISVAREQKAETDRAIAAGSRGFSVIGEARSLADVALAETQGFAMKATVYRRGMLVNATGVARASRAEYESMASVDSLCDELRARVEAEQRRDIVCGARDIEPNADGSLDVHGQRFELTRDSFGGLVTRIGAPSAGAYLAACPPSLRALNLAHWLDQTSNKITMRTRNGANGREVYAVVSDCYIAVDADQIAGIVRDCIEPSARGTLSYDGTRTAIESLYQTTVAPEQFVAGEVFRAGVKITSDDTGGGSLRVSACVYQNLCLNLIVIDRSEKPLMAARHVGQPRRMARELQSAVREAMALVQPFAERWSTAARPSSLESTRDLARTIEGRSVEGDKLMAGIFTALLAGDAKRDPLPVPGRAAAARDRLLRAWASDTSGARGNTRGAIANAITRVAHTDESIDDARRLELERAAGRLIWSTAPLPYASAV